MSSHTQQHKQHKQSRASRIGIALAGFLVAILFLIWISQGSNSKETASSSGTQKAASQSSGTLSASETSFDFGTVSMARGVVKKEIALRTSTEGAATITRIQSSCMCTSAILTKDGRTFGPFGMPGHGFVPPIQEALNPGEEATLEITFDPNAHGPSGVGRIDRVVTVEQSSGAPLQIEFSAVVTP